MRFPTNNWLFILVFSLILIGLAGLGSAQTNISNSPNWFSTCPRIAVDPVGNVHAIWAEFYTMNGYYPSSGDAYYAKYDISTKRWSTPLNLSNSRQCFSGEWYCVGIDTDGSGNVYAVYIDGPSLKLRILSNGSWSSPFDVATAGGADLDSARVAVDAAGDIFVVCRYAGVVYSRARVGGVWEGVVTLTYPGTVSKFPEISVGANQVYCVFEDNHYTPAYYTAVYVRRATTSGAAWSSSQRMTNAANWEEHPAVRVDADDVAHVVFTPYYDSTESRDVRYVEGTSSGFSAPLVLGSLGNVHYPSLAVRGTNVYTCWQSTGVHYRNRVKGAWGSETAIPNAYCDSLTDVAASPYQDKLYYVWDTSSGEIYFSELAGAGPYYDRKLKNDFNRDGHEDILCRYYGPGGYNAVTFLGDSASGAAGIEGSIMNGSAGKFGIVDMPKGQGSQQTFVDPREAGEWLTERAPRQMFGGTRQESTLMGREEQESRKPQPGEVSPVMSGADGNNGSGEPGSPEMKVAGAKVIGAVYLPAVDDPNWRIEGTGDFNGDGKVDILWRNYAAGLGYDVVWFMDGVTLIGSAWLPTVVDTNWRIAGTGDFNGDGKVDILWRYYGAGIGWNVVWFMDGTTLLGWQYLPEVADTNWKIEGTGDFNGDGKVDILWRYYGAGFGYDVVWFMDGTTWTGIGWLPEVADTNWEIGGTGDFNGDGKVDILWRYYGAGFGYNVIWYMNGVTLTGWEYLPAVPDINWRIENH